MSAYTWKAGALEGTADTLAEADRHVRVALGSKGKRAVAIRMTRTVIYQRHRLPGEAPLATIFFPESETFPMKVR